jgi:hypothetical protein
MLKNFKQNITSAKNSGRDSTYLHFEGYTQLLLYQSELLAHISDHTLYHGCFEYSFLERLEGYACSPATTLCQLILPERSVANSDQDFSAGLAEKCAC